MIKSTIKTLIDWFYFKPIQKYIPYVTFRYAACGGGNLMLDWVLYAILYNFVLDKQNLNLGIVTISPYVSAFLIVFPITLFTGFWLNRNIAFEKSPLAGRVQLFRYLIVIGTNILLNYFGIKLLVEILGVYPTPSKMIVSLVSIVFSYFLQRYFTFRGAES